MPEIMNGIKFKIRLKHLNERLIMLQLPELCVDYDATTAILIRKRGHRRRIGNTETRLKLALAEMRSVLELAAQHIKGIEGKEAEA